MDTNALEFGLFWMVTIADGLFPPIGQGLACDPQFLTELFGRLATGQQQTHRLVFKLFAVSVAVFTHVFTF